MSASIRHIAILIPARDEERLLPRCIASVLRAQAMLPSCFTTDIVVIVDSSKDRTLEIATALLAGAGIVLTTQAGAVGVARALAAQAALQRYKGDPETCWLANTDADCEVPDNWLVDQIMFARAGVHAIAGIVDVDEFSEHRSHVARRFRETYLTHADGTHPHVHGANIGLRADVYLRVGGWASLETAEDHDLWNRLSCSGCTQRSIARLKVITSGRRIGRAPHGFAEALAAHNEVAA
jgi:glycosyltransferase involved in cell wall biosynthesis